MISAILGIVLTAVVGSLSVPIILLSLARFGYFEPIELTILGRHFSFAPRARLVVTSGSAATEAFPKQAVFATVVTGLFTVAPPGPMQMDSQAAASLIRSASVVCYRDLP